VIVAGSRLELRCRASKGEKPRYCDVLQTEARSSRPTRADAPAFTFSFSRLLHLRGCRPEVTFRIPPRGMRKVTGTMIEGTLKKKLVARLRRISGQVEGVARMVEHDRYCVDVLLQIAAAQAALGQAGALVLRSHVDTCVSEAMANGTTNQRKKKIAELMDVFSRYSRIATR
jgi:CsoR family transcriptional regulator, copper-sensing transcriptional repressor